MSFDYSTIGKTASYIASETAEETESTSSTTLDQEDFLELLTTQLTNQDPTEPVDTSDMVNTMCQLSIVSSLTEITEGMDDVVDAISSSTAISATTLVGKSVLVDSDEAYFDGTNEIVALIEAGDDGATDITITISDSSGNVVATYTADSGEGDMEFTWDGEVDGETVSAGTYTISVTALQDGDYVSLPVSTYATVTSVTLGSTLDTTTLSLLGYGDITLSEVEEITI